MKKYKLFAWVLLIIGLIILVISSFFFIHLSEFVWRPALLDEKSISFTSAIGSFIGGIVGSIFSLASVFFFIIALKSQQEDSIQKSFETTFFNLLLIQENIRERVFSDVKEKYVKPSTDKIELSNLRNTNLGFRNFFLALKSDSDFLIGKSHNNAPNLFNHCFINNISWDKRNEYLQNELGIHQPELLETIDAKAEIYRRFFGEFRSELGHYFRNLYHILKFVLDCGQKNKSLKQINWKSYIDILQAQMSTYELLLCFYNGLIFDRAKFLYQYYGFLENINKEELIDKDDTKLYENPVWNNDLHLSAPGITFKSKEDW